MATPSAAIAKATRGPNPSEDGDEALRLNVQDVEHLIGHEVSFFNGTHVLCLPNTTLPTSLQNSTDLQCLYEMPPLPRELYFNDDSAVSVIAYSCLFLVAACGNLTVFITLFRNRNMKSRVNLFIMHLAIADLLVTFMMMPLEIAWHATVEWLAGDAACRLMMFFRAFGFYLSSCILVTISLDRYFAIMHPLAINDANRRGKIMLACSWILSIISSIPQSVIFHVQRHPNHRWFKQCVTFNFFPTPMHELAYNLFNIIALYCLPLLIITTSYSLILCKISRKSRQSRKEMCSLDDDFRPNVEVGLRRSALGNIERARIRTLKMTCVIVGAFILCWTPYFVMSAWYWFDSASAAKIDSKIQRGLFLFAVSNSCINPIVYGMFTTAFRRERRRWQNWLKRKLGMFTIKFKREFIRCCYCLHQHWKRRGLSDQNGGAHRMALLNRRSYPPTTSESSWSHGRSDRQCRTPSSQPPTEASVADASLYACRYPLYPMLVVSSNGGCGSSGSGVAGGSEISSESPRMSLNSLTREPLSDRANINNFVKVGSAK